MNLRALSFIAAVWAGAVASAPSPAAAPRDGSRDFDFEIGTWKAHVRRLVKPSSGSTTWVEMDGITKCTKVWNGRANLVELEADGPRPPDPFVVDLEDDRRLAFSCAQIRVPGREGRPNRARRNTMRRSP